MNRNEAIEFLKRNEWGAAVEGWTLMFEVYASPVYQAIALADLRDTESLQSRIETLLDMKFETEEKLLETIGSVWGADFHHRVLDIVKPLRIDSDAGPLDTLKRLVSDSQQKTYWDGVEPLRVGHIVEQGVVEVPAGTKSCIRNHSDELVLVRTSNLKPHPFAKYTEQAREFLQAQIEAGVIKLC